MSKGYKTLKEVELDIIVKSGLIQQLKLKVEELTNDLDREKSKVNEYGIRLIKAIKYIETKWNNDSYFDDIDNCLKFLEINEYDKEDLLDILKGVDKE